MKNQNVNKLVFTKTALFELNDSELNGVNGGSTPGCFSYIIGYTLSLKLTERETECGPN
ncbi:class I lanthipeptide [Flavobacterium amniphilum]|uniref:class I lanthipeptide n=1 Tax=Flavobacterium amniphilum TaxID=1834035 RepID=UPI00202AC1F1|nr:class I lanthipeptide [Flavobacterium amniphilum]MCL9807396.1 class I lanthipeptide [Flavobacterium amniphilum]